MDTGNIDSSSKDTIPIFMGLSLGLEDIELGGSLGALLNSDDAKLSIPSSEFDMDILLPLTAMTATAPLKADQTVAASSVPRTLPSHQEHAYDLPSRSKLEMLGATGVLSKKRPRRISWEWVKDFEADCMETVSMHPSLFKDDAISSTVTEARLEMIATSSPTMSPSINSKTNKNTPFTSSTKIQKKKKRSNRLLDESQAIEPTDNDILFGRGGFTNIHPGNNRFRQKALDLWPLYKRSSKVAKQKITNSLVESVKLKGCRFLEKGKDGLWHEVVHGERRKASQTFRDIARRAY